jgi:RES domain-containing protein
VTQGEAESEYFVCLECCASPLLQELLKNHGHNAQCSLCATRDVRCLGTATDDFLLAAKASIRYYFSEWQYHSKLGEGTLESLFFIDPNPILKVNPAQTDIAREEVILSFLNDVNDRQMEIEIFTAYGRDIYNYIAHTAVSEGDSPILSLAKKTLAEKNHFLVEDEYEKILYPLAPYLSATITTGSRWHRARMGATLAAANLQEIGRPPTYFYEGHKDKSIGAPPIGVATAGRVNRPGVSYLYLASNRETAAAEIRPHPGEQLSLGCFDIVKDLKVVDLRTHYLTKLWRNDDELEKLELIIAMEKMFATAAPPSNRSAYTVTQFLGELFRRLGFDGVVFRSTVETGENLVIFDPSHAAWVEGSSHLIQVRSLRYEWDNIPLYDNSHGYDIDYKRNGKRGY